MAEAGVRPFIVAVAGGSASGKTSLARHLASALRPLRTAVVPEDAYYFSVPGGRAEDGAPYNFDRPETKDFALLLQHLGSACRGESFDRPVYDFATHTRQDETVRIQPCDVLIVEGMHNLGDEPLRALADLTVFVAAGEDIRLARRLMRDVAERGRESGATERQFRTVVAPMHDVHVEPLRAHAMCVVENAGNDAELLMRAADELAMNIRSTLAVRS